MSFVVLDTNILVSSLWSIKGLPSKILKMVFDKQLIICHDYRILNEYSIVLNRPKFAFNPADINDVLDFFRKHGISVIAEEFTEIFLDESDRKFYEVTKTLIKQGIDATFITGNLKHYPKETFIQSAADFFAKKFLI